MGCCFSFSTSSASKARGNDPTTNRHHLQKSAASTNSIATLSGSQFLSIEAAGAQLQSTTTLPYHPGGANTAPNGNNMLCADDGSLSSPMYNPNQDSFPDILSPTRIDPQSPSFESAQQQDLNTPLYKSRGTNNNFTASRFLSPAFISLQNNSAVYKDPWLGWTLLIPAGWSARRTVFDTQTNVVQTQLYEGEASNPRAVFVQQRRQPVGVTLDAAFGRLDFDVRHLPGLCEVDVNADLRSALYCLKNVDDENGTGRGLVRWTYGQRVAIGYAYRAYIIDVVCIWDVVEDVDASRRPQEPYSSLRSDLLEAAIVDSWEYSPRS
eukprot:PhM_4_TR13554/c0_g1_i1/m.52743